MACFNPCKKPIFFLALFACLQAHAGILDQRPQGAVNDFAGLLSPPLRDSLEFLSAALLEKTGVSLVLATSQDLSGGDIDDVATRLYETWGIGKKGKDEGVLVLVAVSERRIRIETGYGSEGYMTDAQASRIIRDYAVPFLSTNRWDEGCKNTMYALAGLVAKAHDVSLPQVAGWAQEMPQPSLRIQGGRVNIFSVLFFILLVLFLLGTRLGRTMLLFMLLTSGRGPYGGGRGFGGFGGGVGGGRGFGGFGGGMSGGGGASGRF
jgi:uncharacterized protein